MAFALLIDIIFSYFELHCYLILANNMEVSVFQLVPAVTELVVAELMYLQWMDPKEPIYLYINSTGTTRDDGETVRP